MRRGGRGARDRQGWGGGEKGFAGGRIPTFSRAFGLTWNLSHDASVEGGSPS